jgi:hypothetical protein
MDSEPFPELHHILQDFKDSRLWVYAEWVCALWPACLVRGALISWNARLETAFCCFVCWLTDWPRVHAKSEWTVDQPVSRTPIQSYGRGNPRYVFCSNCDTGALKRRGLFSRAKVLRCLSREAHVYVAALYCLCSMSSGYSVGAGYQWRQ